MRVGPPLASVRPRSDNAASARATLEDAQSVQACASLTVASRSACSSMKSCSNARATTGQAKRCSAICRARIPQRLRDSGEIAARLKAAVQAFKSPGVTSRPEPPSSTKASKRGRREAITGKPHAIARGICLPRTVSSRAGTASKVAAPINPGNSSRRGRLSQCTREPIPSRPACARSRARSGPSPASTSDQSER